MSAAAEEDFGSSISYSCLASCVVFGPSKSYGLLNDTQEAVKRFLFFSFLVNMSLVKASVFVNKSKMFLLSEGKGSLPCFVVHLQVGHAEVCQDSLLLVLPYSSP